MHKLLARQLKRTLGQAALEGPLASFVEAIDAAYRQYDDDRLLLERSLELTSEELRQRYVDLQADIERRVTTEAELASAREAAALAKEHTRLADLKAHFITRASHEFRTPLTVILATSESLTRYGQRLDSREKQRKLTNLRASALQLAHLLDEILALGDSPQGLAPCRPAPVEVATFCANTLAELGTFPPREIHLEVQCKPPIASLDPNLVRQILANLIDNAIRYSPESSKVEVHVSRSENVLCLRIEDEGAGIADTDQERIFEPFFRCEQSSEIHGVGLGLTIARRAAASHGGTITVRSRPNVGSQFIVELPCVPTVESGARPRIAASQASEVR